MSPIHSTTVSFCLLKLYTTRYLIFENNFCATWPWNNKINLISWDHHHNLPRFLHFRHFSPTTSIYDSFFNYSPVQDLKTFNQVPLIFITPLDFLVPIVWIQENIPLQLKLLDQEVLLHQVLHQHLEVQNIQSPSQLRCFMSIQILAAIMTNTGMVAAALPAAVRPQISRPPPPQELCIQM